MIKSPKVAIIISKARMQLKVLGRWNLPIFKLDKNFTIGAPIIDNTIATRKYVTILEKYHSKKQVMSTPAMVPAIRVLFIKGLMFGLNEEQRYINLLPSGQKIQSPKTLTYSLVYKWKSIIRFKNHSTKKIYTHTHTCAEYRKSFIVGYFM